MPVSSSWGRGMHAIFKDAAARVVASMSDVALFDVHRWLRRSCDGVRCEIYEDDGRTRGPLLTLYVREDTNRDWRPV